MFAIHKNFDLTETFYIKIQLNIDESSFQHPKNKNPQEKGSSKKFHRNYLIKLETSVDLIFINRNFTVHKLFIIIISTLPFRMIVQFAEL